MTILLSVLTESWTKNFRTAIVTGRATRTAQQLSRQTISQTPSLASPLPALENLPRHTLDAVRSFDAHARYFINGRQGEIPEELQALLSTADEFDAAFDGFREGGELSAEQGDEQRRDRGHVRHSHHFSVHETNIDLPIPVSLPCLVRTIPRQRQEVARVDGALVSGSVERIDAPQEDKCGSSSGTGLEGRLQLRVFRWT